MTISAVVFISALGLSYMADEAGVKRVANPLPKLGGVETFIAWGVMLTFLVVLADIESTGPLAVSFAWLFLLAVMFTYGQAAAQNLLALMGEQGSTQPAPSPTGSRYDAIRRYSGGSI